MTKHHTSHPEALPHGSAYAAEDDAPDSTELSEASLPFPGAQYFNKIMREKMRPKRVAKFKASKIPEEDS